MTADDRIHDATRTAALSGAASGGILGAITSLVGGPRARAREILKRALIGAGGVGALSGASTYLGSKIMGPPDEGELHGFTRRGAVGGAVGGGIAGGALGAAIGSKKWAPPVQNAVTDYLKRGGGGRYGALRGAALGALGLGAAGAYQASDEGMQLDFLDEELKRAKLRGVF